MRASDGRTDVFALVSQIALGSLDASRRVAARGGAEASEDALFEHNPELSALLRTELTAWVVGFRQDDAIVHRLPTHPPRLHGFVHRCADAELRAFGDRLDFLDALLTSRGPGQPDELIAAAIRQLAAVRDDPHAYLVAAGKRVAALLAGNTYRLAAILRSASASPP